MDISIQEKKFSFGVEYAIETPTSTLSATKKIFTLYPHVTLQAADDSVLATIKGESLIRTKFNIEMRDGRNYTYHCEKIWKSVDICEGPGGPYRLYAHKGVRYSIFQQDMQIAAFSQERLFIGNGREFDLRLNSNADIPLVIAMVLCSNTEDGNDESEATITYDFGHLGPEDRKFDEAWRPNDECN